jgi:bifunctional non-homologous end joining protein LigD
VSAATDPRPELRFGPYTVTIGNAGKLLFPHDGITKLDLVEHYRVVAPRMLPHAGGRPLSLQRFPDGIGAGGFFQKQASPHFPDWIDTVEVTKAGGTVTHVVASRAADLVFLADQAVIAFHGGLAPATHVDRPDRLVFDLDPSVDDFPAIRDGARMLREVLDDIGLAPFLMATGSRGLHVVAPVSGSETFDEVRPLVEGVAGVLVARDPDRFTVEQRKAKRGDRVLVDWFRNAYGQTAVCPWSVRPKPGAPVAVPLPWDELDDPDLRADRYRIGDIPRLIDDRPDPWVGLARRARSTVKARKALERIIG